MHRIKLAIPLLALAIVGCRTQETVEPAYRVVVLPDRRVTVDSSLTENLTILQVRQAIVQGDLLKVDVEVQSARQWGGDLDYAFEWFDGQGMPFDTPLSAWITRDIGPGETLSLVAVAPNPQIKDFRLKIRQSIRR